MPDMSIIRRLQHAMAQENPGGRDAVRRHGLEFARSHDAAILRDAGCTDLVAWLTQHMHDHDMAASIWDFALLWLGFDRQSDKTWNDFLYQELWLPLYQTAIAAGQDDLALSIEVPLYMDYVEQAEEERHYLTVYDAIKPLWPAPSGVPKRSGQRQGPIIFILHRIARLGHVTIFADFLEGLIRRHGSLPFAAIVYCLDEGQEAMTARLRATGIDIRVLKETGPATALRKVQQASEDHDARMIIWLDNPIYLSFACSLEWSMPFILWAQKFKAFTHPAIDGYLGNGKIFERQRHHNGVTWRIAPNNYSGLDNPDHVAAGDAMRASLALPEGAVLVGTIAREQKIASPAFLDSICRVMQRRPQMHYLYTGHENLPMIRDRFKEAGLADRVHYAGWVNSAVYGAALDVFADSFPAANGQTLLESMIAGKAAVALLSDDTLESMSVLAMASEALDAEHPAHQDLDAIFKLATDTPLLPLGTTIDEYEYWLERLLTDTRLRRKVGRALRKYVQTWFCDNRVMANIYWQHLQDIEAESQSSGAVS